MFLNPFEQFLLIVLLVKRIQKLLTMVNYQMLLQSSVAALLNLMFEVFSLLWGNCTLHSSVTKGI